MAVTKGFFLSKYLPAYAYINYIVPSNITDSTKSLYVLHDYGSNYTCWQSYTSIQRYAEKYNILIIMADFEKSFYTNLVDLEQGFNYWDFASSEMLYITRNTFPKLSNSREDNFVAGIGMGGFGALKLALLCPDKFSQAGMLSGIFDLEYVIRKYPERRNEYALFLGDDLNVLGTDNDLLFNAVTLDTIGLPKPKLYQYCGTNDELYPQNEYFHHFMTEKGFDITYSEDDGTHSWDYWDKELERFLAWLPLEKQVKVSKY